MERASTVVHSWISFREFIVLSPLRTLRIKVKIRRRMIGNPMTSFPRPEIKMEVFHRHGSQITRNVNLPVHQISTGTAGEFNTTQNANINHDDVEHIHPVVQLVAILVPLVINPVPECNRVCPRTLGCIRLLTLCVGAPKHTTVG